MAADLEIDALAAHAERVAQQARSRRAQVLASLRWLTRSDCAIRAYRRVFLDAAGEPSGDAALVIADICAIAQLGRFDPGQVSDAELRERNGARKLALHILSQLDLDGSRLRKLARRMREADGE